jgi:hypothetical protein
MKHTHIGDVLNFDLCDLQKVGQIKNPGIMCHVSLLDVPSNDKNLELIQPLISSGVLNSTLLLFQDGHLAVIFEVRSGRNSHKVRKF